MSKPSKKSIKRAAFVAVALVAIVFYALNHFGIINVLGGREADNLDNVLAEVHYIDVGQGDCELITLSDGTDILIDAGNYSNRTEICNYLKSHITDDIELFVLTHPHADHIGSASEIIKNFTVDKIVMTDDEADSASYEYLLDAILEYDVNVDKAEVGKSYTFGDCSLNLLAPLEQNKDVNECSIVCRFVCDEVSFLFEGDAGNDSEKAMLNSGCSLASTVLKVGHHGSSTSSSEDFLAAVKPEVAVISCGKNNTYGHPSDSALERLTAVGASAYRTDINGTVTISTDGKEFVIETEKQ